MHTVLQAELQELHLKLGSFGWYYAVHGHLQLHYLVTVTGSSMCLREQADANHILCAQPMKHTPEVCSGSNVIWSVQVSMQQQHCGRSSHQ